MSVSEFAAFSELRKVMQAAQDKVAPTHQPQGNGDDFFYSLIDDVEKIIALQRAIFKVYTWVILLLLLSRC